MNIILAENLDEFPPARRKAIWWKTLLSRAENRLDDYVRTASPEPCRDWNESNPWRQRRLAPHFAHLGSDGRYHLVAERGLICADGESNGAAYRHRNECSWWTDGTSYRRWTPAHASDPANGTLIHGERDDHTANWLVTIDPTPVAPETIPARQRCVHHTTNTEWPAHLDPKSRIGRIRIRLVNEFGSDCHACGTDIGVTVDHDHFTGVVRGLLCRECNTFIDDCLHLSGCRWADYLNSPPAKALHLIYPHPDKVRNKESAQQRIAHLGYDPLFSGLQRERQLAKARPGPPPPRHSDQLGTSQAVKDTLF